MNQQPSYNPPPYTPPPSKSLVQQVLALLQGPSGGIIIAGAVLVSMCVFGFCAVVGIVVLRGAVTPPTPTPQPTATEFVLDITPNVFVTPTVAFVPSVVGTIVNPYDAGNLINMTQLQLDVLDPVSKVYVPKGIFTADQLTPFATALNIGVFMRAPDANCPDHARITATLSTGGQVVLGLCLNGGVYVRSPYIPALGGADAEMGPYFSDVLQPYLPQEYISLLQFGQ